MTYVPDLNFYGRDSFTFTVSDGSGTSAAATITITVNPVNDVPTAIGFSETTPEDTPVTLTLLGSDPEGDALTFSIVDQPTNGTVGPVTGSSVTYTPNPNFTGVDGFTFSVSDGSSTSTPAIVMITVTPAVDPRAAIAALIRQVDGLNLNRGLRLSLRSQLEAVQSSLLHGRRSAAVNQLRAFIREVWALRLRWRLDAPTASSLIVQAQQAIEMLTDESVAMVAHDAAQAEIDRAIAKVGVFDRRVVLAQRHFDLGLAAMNAGEFRRAAREFGLAFQIAQRI
ncbi:MAG: tandem-95 repeat protein [Deltaproteobacteria bacterium]|nr:tandem-95 repeat protein [Deltaproteobacteria bacterium]